MVNVLAIIPTYNESANIVELLTRVDNVRSELSSNYKIDIVIIDDNSPDKTIEIAKSLQMKNLSALNRTKKSGLGPAYLAGFNLGLTGDYQFFIQMDADLSHMPEQLENLLESASSKSLVIGTRWMPGGSVVNWPFHRRFISKLGTKYASIALDLDYKDLTSGYRILPREMLETIDLSGIKTKGYGFQIEVALKAHDAGFEIKQVPITFIERENGRSKMGPKIVWEAWFKVSIWGFKRIISRR
ncbi:MAG: polyprenol monophosphomannose synthase [Actinomycetota bacterium]|nr:polyprenol monophosphomannose synthase [Actinomycetota bacterium]